MMKNAENAEISRSSRNTLWVESAGVFENADITQNARSSLTVLGVLTMHSLYAKADSLTGQVIGAAIEVQRYFGLGLLESIYVKCLERELNLMGLTTCREIPVRVEYKGMVFDECLRMDLLVEDCLVIEAKAVSVEAENMDYYKAQTLSYLKFANKPLGLVINFHNPKLAEYGVRRVILKGANK